MIKHTNKPSKFAVVGSGCSGKTTISRIIGKQLNIKVIEIDAVLYKPNWVERSQDDLRRIIDAETVKDSWVIDGNYRKLYDLTAERADVVIWLNFSFLRVFSRALLRTVNRITDKKDIFPGCKETFYKALFTKQSIPWGVLIKWNKKRNQYRNIFDEKAFGDREYKEFHNQKDLDKYVATLQS